MLFIKEKQAKTAEYSSIKASGSGYIKSLDGIRAVAILLVLSFHTNLTRFGWMGVQLFFVLSGYLITNILIKEKYKATAIRSKFKKFWIRRVLRIFPVYYLYLIILGAIYLLLKIPGDYPLRIIHLATYTFNFTRAQSNWSESPFFTHLWSLSVEEQFYLFFPFIVFLLPRKWLKVAAIFLIFSAPAFRWWYQNHLLISGKDSFTTYDAVYWMTFSHLDAFLLGAAIPIFDLAKKIKKPQWLFIIALSLFTLGGLVNHLLNPYETYIKSFGYGFGRLTNGQSIWCYTLCDLFFAAAILLLVTDHLNNFSQLFSKILENNILVRIGKVSYGMYIIHWVILAFVFERFINMHVLVNQIIVFIPYCVIVYLAAEISYNGFEKYFMRLKDKLAPSPKEKNSANIL